MPGYRTHLMGGFTAYIVLLYIVQSLKPTPLAMVEWLGFALMGSLFPDIDIKSKGQLWFFRLVSLLLLGLAIRKQYAAAIMLAISSIVPLLVRHRGLFHRPWFIVIMPLASTFIVSNYLPCYSIFCYYDALFFIVGALSHIWLDMGFLRLFR